MEWGYHLIWVDNEHATHRDLKMPRIDARLFDPVADRRIQDKLSTDAAGPLALSKTPAGWKRRQDLPVIPQRAREIHAAIMVQDERGDQGTAGSGAPP